MFPRFVIPAVICLLPGCVSSPNYHSQPRYNTNYANTAPSACYDCGTVASIEYAPTQQNTAAGAVLGGIVGAVVGKELGRSFSGSRGKRNVSAAAGAVGGAIVGSAIQNQMQAGASGYVVHVRMHDGRTQSIHVMDAGGLQQGMPVRVQNGQIYIE